MTIITSFFKELFPSKFSVLMSDYKRQAYHESGHIVIAYFFGYTCDEVCLMKGDSTHDYSTINYRSDLTTISGIINFKNDPGFFKRLTEEEKCATLDLADRISTILAAGSVAEEVYRAGSTMNRKLPVEIAGSDLGKILNVDYFLSRIRNGHDKTYVKGIVDEVMLLLSIPKIWNSIDSLARNLLRQPGKCLKKPAIEAVLRANDYLDFVKVM